MNPLQLEASITAATEMVVQLPKPLFGRKTPLGSIMRKCSPLDEY